MSFSVHDQSHNMLTKYNLCNQKQGQRGSGGVLLTATGFNFDIHISMDQERTSLNAV